MSRTDLLKVVSGGSDDRSDVLDQHDGLDVAHGVSLFLGDSAGGEAGSGQDQGQPNLRISR